VPRKVPVEDAGRQPTDLGNHLLLVVHNSRHNIRGSSSIDCNRIPARRSMRPSRNFGRLHSDRQPGQMKIRFKIRRHRESTEKHRMMRNKSSPTTVRLEKIAEMV
jgi:hypothetical protein